MSHFLKDVKGILKRLLSVPADGLMSSGESTAIRKRLASKPRWGSSMDTIVQELAGIQEQLTSLQRRIASLSDPAEPPRFLNEVSSGGRAGQLLLSLKYQELLRQNCLPKFEDVGFRVFSQNDEDGLLLYVFSLIGTTNKKAVEVCAGNGIECNTANLIVNHGWVGLLVDGDRALLEQGKDFYSRCPDTFWLPPSLVQAWVTTDNINSLIRDQGFEEEIDLLSIDMDGVDYWIWKAIDCIRPRVVVLEYNWGWGPEESMTVPNKADFRMPSQKDSPDEYAPSFYFGASLSAFIKLGREKGYRLVGCQHWGFNAFFVRSDIFADILPEIPPSKCYEIPVQKKVWYPELPEILRRWEWVEV